MRGAGPARVWRAHDRTDGETVTVVRTRLKMAATLTVVVLALTGFQTSSGGGKGGGGKSKSKSSGGGGCSSDKKDNDDYSGSGGSDGSGGSGGEYTAEPAPSASASTAGLQVTVVDCVKPAQKKRKGKPARKADTTATVRITNNALYGTTETFEVTLWLKNAKGAVADTITTKVKVGHGEQKDVEMKMTKPGRVDDVKACEVFDVHEV